MNSRENRNDSGNRVRSQGKTRTRVLAVGLALTACGGGDAQRAAPPHATTSASSGAAPSPGAHGERGHHGSHDVGHTHAHRFDDAARWAKVFDDPERDAWQKPSQVVAAMEIAPGMRVADVGAGTGYFEPHLSRAVGPTGKVLAVDLEPSMVAWIKARAEREHLTNVEAILGAAADPNLPPETVDRVLIVDTWHHVADRPAYAARLAKALTPNGAVFVVDFTPDSPYGPPPAMRLPVDAVERDLASAGLSTSRVEQTGLPHQYVVRGRRAAR